MQEWINASVQWLLTVLALPEVGLPTIFVVSLISATLLPLGSEPAVFGYVTLQPGMFWAAVLVATLGNTIGGAISYGMGYAAHRGVEKLRQHKLELHGPPAPEPYAQVQTRHDRWHVQARVWLDKYGPKTLLLSWMPLVGDPLCAVAGWLKLDFWPSLFYMAVGKLLRYVTMTAGLLWLFPH